MAEPPTRSEVAAALIAVCDILLAVDAVATDAEMPTKRRAIKNYADTLFSGADCNNIRQALRERPALLQALRESDMPGACAHLQQEDLGAEQSRLDYALQCVSRVNPELGDDDRASLWGEIHLLCDLAI